MKNKNKERTKLAKKFFEVAWNIATSEEPVTDERLMLGEMFLEMAAKLIKRNR